MRDGCLVSGNGERAATLEGRTATVKGKEGSLMLAKYSSAQRRIMQPTEYEESMHKHSLGVA